MGRAGGPPDNTTSEETEEDVKNKSEIKQAVKKTSQTGWAQPGLGSIVGENEETEGDDNSVE